jgi:hypothetical protein
LGRAWTPQKPDDPRRCGGIPATRTSGGGGKGEAAVLVHGEGEAATRRVKVSMAVGKRRSRRFIVRVRAGASTGGAREGPRALFGG